MSRPIFRSRVLRTVAAAAGVVGLTAVTMGSAPATETAPINPKAPYGYYVSIGDSLAQGYQPGIGDAPRKGYNAPVLSALRKGDWPNTDQRSFGCSGETSTTLLKGGKCSAYATGSQITEAEKFMKGRTNVRLITVSIGGNDVTKCVNDTTGIDLECIQTAAVQLKENYGEIAKRLRAVAPKAQIVLLDNYDVFLGEYVKGAEGQEVAKLSLILAHIIGGVTAYSAWEGQADVAKVSTYFHSDSWRPYKSAKYGTQPRNVAAICDWTSYCSRKDIHPNDAGYARMGQAIVAEL